MNKQDVYQVVEGLTPLVKEIAQHIWKFPEISGEEKQSSDYLRRILSDEGFKIINEENIPCAFYAEYGYGKPVIAVLGEYDALPKLSQQVCPYPSPVENEAPGHGCGHNLMAAGSTAGAIAIKRLLEKTSILGTVRFYGCPEEELCSGKVKMAYYHMFDGCDIAISWHPMSINMTYDGGYLASGSARFHFHGKTAHAAVAPEVGRSALDAVELMSVGANYLREHIPANSRIHYTTNSGGFPPNIVPDYAESWYFARASNISEVKNLFHRLDKIAQGAAMMTETTSKIQIDFACCEMRNNHQYGNLTQQNLIEAGKIIYTEDELAFARELQTTIDPVAIKKYQDMFACREPLFSGYAPRDMWKNNPLIASSDSGDVSQIMPMNLFTTACWPIGCVAHTWQASASAGSSIGEKGAFLAAKIIAGIGYDLLTKTDLLLNIRKEFAATGGAKHYHPTYGISATV